MTRFTCKYCNQERIDFCPECSTENKAICLECKEDFELDKDIQLCMGCIDKFDLDELWRLHDLNELDALDFNENDKFRERFRLK
jgi:hypothetical protein